MIKLIIAIFVVITGIEFFIFVDVFHAMRVTDEAFNMKVLGVIVFNLFMSAIIGTGIELAQLKYFLKTQTSDLTQELITVKNKSPYLIPAYLILVAMIISAIYFYKPNLPVYKITIGECLPVAQSCTVAPVKHAKVLICECEKS